MKTTFSTGKKYTHNGRRYGTLVVGVSAIHGMDTKALQKLIKVCQAGMVKLEACELATR